MIGYAVLYLGLVAIIFAFTYMHSDQCRTRMQAIETRVGGVELKQLAQIKVNQEVSESKTILGTSVSVINALAKSVETIEEEIEVFRDQCASVIEEQIKIKKHVSSLRPLIKLPSGALQVEIIPSQSAPSERTSRPEVARASPGKSDYKPAKNLGKQKKK
jgi:hypothetical protein